MIFRESLEGRALSMLMSLEALHKQSNTLLKS
jgi:hypothetical protein